MVKVINIDTKTRTIRVENADGDIKTWRTTESGAHFPIKKGESTKEALDKFVEKKRGTGIDEKVPRNLPPELKKKEQESAKAREKLQKDLRKDVFGPSEKETSDTKGTMKESATDWYSKKFKRDKDMAPKGTFEDIYASIKQGKDPFDDSIVRERVFEEMSKRLNKPYEHLYDMWLHGGEKGSQARIEKQKKTIAEFDKLLKTDLDPDLKRAIIAARDRAKKDIHEMPSGQQSSQPTSYDLDDAFDEADLGSEWGRAKHRMDFHGVSQYTIKDIIDSGKYEAGDIIEALQSSSHDKIDEMRKSLKDK